MFFRRTIELLEQINCKLGILIQQEGEEMATLDDILAEATRGTTIGQSVIALVQQLVTQAGGDPVKLQAALDAMKGNDDAIEAAVLANTPQA